MTWICLVPCLTSGLARDQGLVLCFGLDGHFDISSWGTRCIECPTAACSDVDAGSPTANTILDLDRSCCPCVDVPVETSNALLRRDVSGPAWDFLDLVSNIPSVYPLSMPDIRPALTTADLVTPYSPLAQLRSIVLLV